MGVVTTRLDMLSMMMVMLTTGHTRLRSQHLPMPVSTVQRAEQDANEQHPGKQSAIAVDQFHRACFSMMAIPVSGRQSTESSSTPMVAAHSLKKSE